MSYVVRSNNSNALVVEKKEHFNLYNSMAHSGNAYVGIYTYNNYHEDSYCPWLTSSPTTV